MAASEKLEHKDTVIGKNINRKFSTATSKLRHYFRLFHIA